MIPYFPSCPNQPQISELSPSMLFNFWGLAGHHNCLAVLQSVTYSQLLSSFGHFFSSSLYSYKVHTACQCAQFVAPPLCDFGYSRHILRTFFCSQYLSDFLGYSLAGCIWVKHYLYEICLLTCSVFPNFSHVYQR